MKGISEDILKDLERAKAALDSARRNLEEKDILTTANRTFVACENVVYCILKKHFGSTSVSRQKILTTLGLVNANAKSCYTDAYDLRVQADYGRTMQRLPLTQENMSKVLVETEKLYEKTRKESEV